MKEVQGCHPQPGRSTPTSCDATPARDCVLENWNDWTSCPVTCGGGQEYRQRHILSPPSHNGKPCTQSIGETRPCNGTGQIACPRTCIDCVWQEWSPWGACSNCNGQKWRTRNVQHHGNYCGAKCEAKVAKQVMNCTGSCGGQLFCSWTPWTKFEGCSAQCGPQTLKRQRTMHLTTSEPLEGYLFKGKAPLACSGTQFNSSACPLIKCPVSCPRADCAYHGWSEWHDNRCTGLATHHRQMATVGRCGGKICNASLIESKAVPVACIVKKDCIWNDWAAWNTCHSAGQQSHRARAIYKMPQMGGKPCEGPMVETKPCVKVTKTHTDCSFQKWFPWSHCSVSCGVGWQMRNRQTIPSVNGGKPCKGDLKELRACDITSKWCGLGAVGAPCEFDRWSQWSMCLATGQRNRVRHIKVMGRYGVKGCKGSLEELGACGPGRQDCELSQWTVWDACDRSCGGGQQQRNRQINNQPEGGGLKCGKNLVETQVCNTGPCGLNDCVWGEWTAPSACTATCGSGQSTRTRVVKQKRRPTGMGCKGNSEEKQPCKTGTACQAVDCKYSEWFPWNLCTKKCGGGQQYRTRAPSFDAAPGSGGAACPILSKKEVRGCNTEKCAVHQCKDSSFSEWSKWTQCTSDCMGGIKSRTRSIIRGNDCGKQVDGRTHEVTPCWTKKALR